MRHHALACLREGALWREPPIFLGGLLRASLDESVMIEALRRMASLAAALSGV